jgi:hypothetical protein
LLAGKDGGDPPGGEVPTYLRYQMRSAKESVQDPGSGVLGRPAKHVPRRWQLQNDFGTLTVDSKKVTAMLLPANMDPAVPPAAPTGGDHFVCYGVKPAKQAFTDQTPGKCDRQAPSPNASCLTEEDCGGVSGITVFCAKPKFAKDLQSFFKGELNDCANDAAGGPSFAGTSVAGACMFDLKKVKELCNPMNKRAVEPPRTTTAVIEESTAASTTSLLCYQVKLGSRFRGGDAAALAQAAIGDKLDPKQAKHMKRRVKDGNPLRTAPGNSVPAPSLVDTKKQEMVCVPTEVVAVSVLP